MAKEELERIDGNPKLRERLLPLCRLKPGEIWTDPLGQHRVGVLDCRKREQMEQLFQSEKARLMVHDPPYNVEVGGRNSDSLSRTSILEYLEFSKTWIEIALSLLEDPGFFYLWLGADQARGFQPLPELMLLMREFSDLESRSFITLRNQRGYGTGHNWMALRQELLCYRRGKPDFFVQYTEIPKILQGYYKTLGGKRLENQERSKSKTLRASNVWVDVQQVFYRRQENVPGAYAQKPLKAIERILLSGTRPGELIADFFSHSGTSLVASEVHQRRCFTCDIDPIFAEISIRRLEQYRKTGKTGWQWKSPFPELQRE